jgi:GDP-4-dehydro-6-deoxy-D-mannose reductase
MNPSQKNNATNIEKSELNVLITGISGFVGSHLTEFLLKLSTPKINLFGTYLQPDSIQPNLGPWTLKLKLFPCDITRPSEIESILRELQPNLIFHLAGISYVPEAEQNPLLTYQVNALAVNHLLEGVFKICPSTRVILISTSEVYGKVTSADLPLTECHPINPYNAYSASKAMMEIITRYKINRHGLNALILRSFNHTGPRQSDQFVISNFSKQIARIKLGLEEPELKVGDLDTQRDFTDVRDIARGYWLAAIQGRSGEIYNLCSGNAYAIRQITSLLIELAGMPIKVFQDPSRLRKSDLPILQGSYEKFKQDTGWEPQYNLKSTLKEMLQYWMTCEETLNAGHQN